MQCAVACSRASENECARLPAVSAACLQTPHGPLMGNVPRLGTPAIEICAHPAYKDTDLGLVAKGNQQRLQAVTGKTILHILLFDGSFSFEGENVLRYQQVLSIKSC